MATQYSFTVTTPKPVEEVFDLVADLRRLPSWDPETNAVEQTSDGDAAQVGARFRVTGRKRKLIPETTMDYEIMEFERPHRIVARGTADEGSGVDTFTFRALPEGGSEVVYETAIELKGVGKVVAPLAGVLVRRSGDKTRAGLEQALNSG
jgi:uncharacterized protein YndB with AHSA1/START domain